MPKLKVALSILAALTLGGGTIGTAPAGSPRSSIASMAGQAPSPTPAARATLGSSAGSLAAGSPSGIGTVAPRAGRPSRVPPACPPALGTSPAPVFLCQPCPAVVANPTGLCPLSAPAPGVRPIIIFCPQPPVVLRPVPGTTELRGFVCGHGFRGNEAVTITATGLHGSYSWQVTASSSGSFVSPLPSFLCRLAPLTLVAKGSSGDRSNGLALSESCLVTL